MSMFSIIIKGQRNPRNLSNVKLTMVFYKSGFPRVTKVIYITGLYEDWQKDAQSFIPNTSDNRHKNNLLQNEQLKYLNVAEKWESQNKNWLPVELSHFFDTKPEIMDKYTSVSKIISQMQRESAARIRIRNGREFDNHRNAKTFYYLKKLLERFVSHKYRKDFDRYTFRDITEKFIEDFIIYSKIQGAKKGNRGGLPSKLRMLQKVFEYAQMRKLYNVNIHIFDKFQTYLTESPVVTKAVSHETIMKIEQIDRTILKKHEHLYLDLFLFSYYAGGMSGIDVCFLERHMVIKDTIKYERIKTDKICRVILTAKALEIIERYRELAYMNYLFPVFKRKDMSQSRMYSRVNYITKMVSQIMNKICSQLGIVHHITWGTARSSFICKMLDEGYHVFQIAEMTGNSPFTIYKNYYGITNKEDIKINFSEIFGDKK